MIYLFLNSYNSQDLAGLEIVGVKLENILYPQTTASSVNQMNQMVLFSSLDEDMSIGEQAPNEDGSCSDEGSLPPTPFTPTSNYPCSEVTHYSLAVHVDDDDLLAHEAFEMYLPNLFNFLRGASAGPGIEIDPERLTLEVLVGELANGVVTVKNTGSTAIYYTWKPINRPSLSQVCCLQKICT